MQDADTFESIRGAAQLNVWLSGGYLGAYIGEALAIASDYRSLIVLAGYLIGIGFMCQKAFLVRRLVSNLRQVTNEAPPQGVWLLFALPPIFIIFLITLPLMGVDTGDKRVVGIVVSLYVIAVIDVFVFIPWCLNRIVKLSFAGALSLHYAKVTTRFAVGTLVAAILAAVLFRNATISISQVYQIPSSTVAGLGYAAAAIAFMVQRNLVTDLATAHWMTAQKKGIQLKDQRPKKLITPADLLPAGRDLVLTATAMLLFVVALAGPLGNDIKRLFSL